jgi:hypothetical protein
VVDIYISRFQVAMFFLEPVCALIVSLNGAVTSNTIYAGITCLK